MSKNVLSKYEDLRKGDYLVSNNGNWKAIFQDDGNFVIYGWKPVWASDTAGSDAFRVVMQGDSNLVMYNKSNTPKWHTNTAKGESTTCCLRLTDDGNLLVSQDYTDIWNSATSKGTK